MIDPFNSILLLYIFQIPKSLLIFGDQSLFKELQFLGWATPYRRTELKTPGLLSWSYFVSINTNHLQFSKYIFEGRKSYCVHLKGKQVESCVEPMSAGQEQENPELYTRSILPLKIISWYNLHRKETQCSG